jgi:hypothetical protein
MGETAPTDRSELLGYLLRRAEQEAIAAIRAADSNASTSHAMMARIYGDRARSILGEPQTG